jgi:sugar transferase (PEP-CTERM/EpsH1 system associated)
VGARVKVLFLAHRIPYPPDKGDKIRAFHFLEHLTATHQVWLGAAADDPADMRYVPVLREKCTDVCVAPLGPLRRVLNMLSGFHLRLPLSVARFRHRQLDAWIARVLEEVQPDVVFVYSSALAQYLIGRVKPGTRVVVDFVDADAEKWRAYAAETKPPMRWVYAREFAALVKFERRALDLAQSGILISETERGLLGDFIPEGRSKLAMVPNGVDTEYFRQDDASPRSQDIVLCGRMDYLPNIDAAQWFVESILPEVRRVCPQAVFRIVGAQPTAEVLALAKTEGVEVTGSVPDVRPYLAQAAVVVAPLRIARGIQNKVLEGLSAGRPVVATPNAVDGIGAEPGRDVLVAADAADFARAVTQVLRGEAAPDLAANGRRYVVEHHQWSAQMAKLDALLFV